jgi:plasmid stabilization system protein ParE
VCNCLQTENNPEDYNEEDLKAIMDYEGRVAFRLSEREHYKKMLEREFHTLSQTLRVRNFQTLHSFQY